MRDTIYRDAAIDALKEHRALFCDNTPDAFSKLSYGEKCRVDELDTAISTLVNLPSAQPEPQWIPCSEPPEEDGVYIVYAPTYSGGSSSAKECHNGVMFSKYKNGKWSIEHGYYSRPNCVKAWKPLDEPWRGEEK